jgi:hypothetical protein
MYEREKLWMDSTIVFTHSLCVLSNPLSPHLFTNVRTIIFYKFYNYQSLVTRSLFLLSSWIKISSFLVILFLQPPPSKPFFVLQCWTWVCKTNTSVIQRLMTFFPFFIAHHHRHQVNTQTSNLLNIFRFRGGSWWRCYIKFLSLTSRFLELFWVPNWSLE